MQQAIVKQFEFFKRGKALNLKTVSTSQRKGITGISTGKFGQVWFDLPKGKALFKIFDWGFSHTQASTDMRTMNELLCSRLSKQIGLLCADYERAGYEKQSGLVSYNLLRDGEEVDDVMYPTMQRLMRYINAESAMGVQVDVQATRVQVFKAALLQLLTLQTDAKTDGYVFARDQDKHTLRFAGLVDNELAFFAQGFEGEIGRQRTARLGQPLQEESIAAFVREYDQWMHEKENFCQAEQLCISMQPLDQTTYKCRIDDLCSYARSDAQIMQVLRDCLKKLDVESAVQDMEKLDGVKPNETYLQFTKAVVEYGKSQIEKNIAQENA